MPRAPPGGDMVRLGPRPSSLKALPRVLSFPPQSRGRTRKGGRTLQNIPTGRFRGSWWRPSAWAGQLGTKEGLGTVRSGPGAGQAAHRGTQPCLPPLLLPHTRAAWPLEPWEVNDHAASGLALCPSDPSQTCVGDGRAGLEKPSREAEGTGVQTEDRGEKGDAKDTRRSFRRLRWPGVVI